MKNGVQLSDNMDINVDRVCAVCLITCIAVYMHVN